MHTQPCVFQNSPFIRIVFVLLKNDIIMETKELLCPATSLSTDVPLVCCLPLPSNTPSLTSEFPLEVEFFRWTSDGRHQWHAPRGIVKTNIYVRHTSKQYFLVKTTLSNDSSLWLRRRLLKVIIIYQLYIVFCYIYYYCYMFVDSWAPECSFNLPWCFLSLYLVVNTDSCYPKLS